MLVEVREMTESPMIAVAALSVLKAIVDTLARAVFLTAKVMRHWIDSEETNQ
jgi:hypothetical protein